MKNQFKIELSLDARGFNGSYCYEKILKEIWKEITHSHVLTQGS